eukprot:c18877_g1_i1 orf=605-1600(-)
MTIYAFSGASYPAKKQSSDIEEAQAFGRRKEMQMYVSSNSPSRQWELRKIASFPALEADFWSDASLSLPHLAPELPEAEDMERISPLHPHPPAAAQEPIKARCSVFPPPLDSPVLCEGRYPDLQSLDKVRFTSTRSNGRLLLTEVPPLAVQTRRRLHTQRCNGRLLLQIYNEGSSSEMEQSNPFAEAGGAKNVAVVAREEDPHARRENKENPTGEEAIEEDPTAKRAIGENPFAEKAEEEEGAEAERASQDLLSAEKEAEEARGMEGGEDKINEDERKGNLYTKVLKTLECDAFTDYATDVLNPKSNGVASFLHKSLTRVRPLSMLNLWQS